MSGAATQPQMPSKSIKSAKNIEEIEAIQTIKRFVRKDLARRVYFIWLIMIRAYGSFGRSSIQEGTLAPSNKSYKDLLRKHKNSPFAMCPRPYREKMARCVIAAQIRAWVVRKLSFELTETAYYVIALIERKVAMVRFVLHKKAIKHAAGKLAMRVFLPWREQTRLARQAYKNAEELVQKELSDRTKKQKNAERNKKRRDAKKLKHECRICMGRSATIGSKCCNVKTICGQCWSEYKTRHRRADGTLQCLHCLQNMES